MTKRRTLLGRMLAGALLCLASAGPAPAAEAELTPARVALQWLPQSQFAGFYMARDQGFYRDVGLDVTLIHTGPGPSALDVLVEDRAEFATLFLSDALVAAEEPVPLAHIAQWVQHSNLMLVAWKDAGIEQPSDLRGKRISVWPGAFSHAIRAFLHQHGIESILLPQHYSIELFLKRGVAACTAMEYNEFHRIYQAGVDIEQLTVFRMRDYGLGFPEDGIYTTRARAAEQPELCRALRAATLAGWEYARANPETALDAVLLEARQAGVPANRPHSRWMLTRILESIFPAADTGQAGRLAPAEYRRAVEALGAAEMIRGAPAFDVFAPLAGEAP